MITYYPWSDRVLQEALDAQDLGRMPTLDFEFTAKCTLASCIYCDSRPDVGQRHPNELNWRETQNLLEKGGSLGLKWVYACGLGEPLEDRRFERMVEAASKLGIRLSMFTNGILIDKAKAKWLHENAVCLILKLDTLEESTFDTILGKRGTATRIYAALDSLLDVGYGRQSEHGCTDIAISIVPTRLNVSDIRNVIEFAKKHGVFPSIGELEQAGRTLERTAYADLALKDEEIRSLKKEVDDVLWTGYTRPICPAIVTGLHIDNVGNCVVDSDTGLNCKWFLLSEPSVRILGNVREDDLAEMFKAVREYRWKCFAGNGKAIRRCETTEYTFGGCGGNPRAIVDLARKHLDERKELRVSGTNGSAVGSVSCARRLPHATSREEGLK